MGWIKPYQIQTLLVHRVLTSVHHSWLYYILFSHVAWQFLFYIFLPEIVPKISFIFWVKRASVSVLILCCGSAGDYILWCLGTRGSHTKVLWYHELSPHTGDAYALLLEPHPQFLFIFHKRNSWELDHFLNRKVSRKETERKTWKLWIWISMKHQGSELLLNSL